MSSSLSDIVSLWPPQHHAIGISSWTLDPKTLAQELATNELAYLYERSYELFGVDDARELNNLQQERSDNIRVFVVRFESINHEAQNALLKLLEEPSANTYFFLIYPRWKELLLTLQSRVSIVTYEDDHALLLDESFSVDDFLLCSLPERFELIKKLTDKSSGDERLDKSRVMNFLGVLETRVAEMDRGDRRTKLLDLLYDARKFLLQNGASSKMVLDLVAMSL